MKFRNCCIALAITISTIITTAPVAMAKDGASVTSTGAPTRASMRAANGQLSKLAVTALYKRKDLESNDIHAIARNGKVTLVGMTASQEQIDLAGKIVEEVPGVISITNNLTVEEPGN